MEIVHHMNLQITNLSIKLQSNKEKAIWVHEEKKKERKEKGIEVTICMDS